MRFIPKRRSIVAILAATSLALSAAWTFGLASVSADSRCDQHYQHEHGMWWWHRVDAYTGHGDGIGPNGYYTHWADHENSPKDWCDS
ncbi:MAG: hypothetical protein F4Y02_00750 [Chloroflexi bacterium]|nr:hypothetical protein [Chloroflexota bacterium]